MASHRSRDSVGRLDDEQLFVSFWHVCLNNLPEGAFVHRRLPPSEAKQLIDAARSTGKLACVSHDDLLAPYHEDEQRHHDALCEALTNGYGVALSFEDFLSEDEVEGEAGYMIRPLVFAEVSRGSRLLIVNCHYAMPMQHICSRALAET